MNMGTENKVYTVEDEVGRLFTVGEQQFAFIETTWTGTYTVLSEHIADSEGYVVIDGIGGYQNEYGN